MILLGAKQTKAYMRPPPHSTSSLSISLLCNFSLFKESQLMVSYSCQSLAEVIGNLQCVNFARFRNMPWIWLLSCDLGPCHYADHRSALNRCWLLGRLWRVESTLYGPFLDRVFYFAKNFQTTNSSTIQFSKQITTFSYSPIELILSSKMTNRLRRVKKGHKLVHQNLN